MEIDRRNTSKRMSQVVVHGETIYLSGQVAQKAPRASIKEQTAAILNEIDDLLGQVGSDKNKLLSATIWLTSMDNFDEMNKVWDSWLIDGKAPCRACVESPRLATSDYDVEIGVIAAK